MRDPDPRNVSWQVLSQCERCDIRGLVLFADLTEEDFAHVHLPVDDIMVPAGEALYRSGQQASAVFTVRQGLLKLEQYLPDGTQRIVSLLRQGDVAGLEAVVSETYEHAAVALRDVRACRIPRDVIKRLSPRLHRQLMNKWHDAVKRSHDCLRDLSTGSARQRMARLFLLLAGQGTPCRLFGREDAGALLGVTTETASRTVAEFKRQDLVREISANLFECDLAALETLAAAD